MDIALNTTAMPNIKDFIVDITHKQGAITVSYSLILENHRDFIISRRTPKTERILAVLTSQALFYIKDVKTDVIEEINEKNIKAFLKDLTTPINFLQLKWMTNISKESSEVIKRVMGDDIFMDMCRHGYYNAATSMEWLKPFYQRNPKLFQFIHKTFPCLSETKKYGNEALKVIYEIADNFGVNEARYFANQFIISGIERLCCYRYYAPDKKSDLVEIASDENNNLNFKAFVDYILFGMYSQGKSNLEGFWREYADYLHMQIEFYGKIVEKYPKHFATEHDILTLKYNLKKKEFDRKKFRHNMENFLPLEYKGQDYSILVPLEPQELADEGVSLSHCVKDYIGRVIGNECAIVFLRHNRRLDTPLVTIQVTNNVVFQAQGQSRRPTTIKEKKFICNWAAKNGLEVRV